MGKTYRKSGIERGTVRDGKQHRCRSNNCPICTNESRREYLHRRNAHRDITEGLGELDANEH